MMHMNHVDFPHSPYHCLAYADMSKSVSVVHLVSVLIIQMLGFVIFVVCLNKSYIHIVIIHNITDRW